MRYVAAILLIAVFVRHEAIYWLADVTGVTPGMMNRLLGGAEEIIFGGVIAFLLYAYRETAWRNLALGACAISALEGAQIVTCRLAIGDMSKVPSRVDLCSHITGLPMTPIMGTLYLLIICYALGRILWKD